jgi:metallo-beta-lactamase class B
MNAICRRPWLPRGASVRSIPRCILVGVALFCGVVFAEPEVIAPNVSITQVSPGIWMHVTTLDGGKFPTNGLLLETAKGSVLVDAGWGVAQTEALLDFAKTRLRRPVVRTIITHSHQDRAGGIAAIRKRGLPVLLYKETARILKLTGKGIDAIGSESILDVGGERLEVFFPGHGHSPDNVVVWLPRQRILFGGCAIKGGEANDLGNVKDANLNRWVDAISALRTRYSSAEIVIPGHGARGGPDLLGHTLALLKPGTAEATK